MQNNLGTVFSFASLILALVSTSSSQALESSSDTTSYQSPYKLALTEPKTALLKPNSVPPRDNWRLESSTPYERWYSHRTLRIYKTWGPEARRYPPIAHISQRPLSWKRQRVLAVAEQLIGLPYQHHHIPNWDPPKNWPWKKVAFGRNSKGMDCSDFSSWIYNYGLGLKLPTGIRKQADADFVQTSDRSYSTKIETIANDGSFDSMVRKLKPADLLFIKHTNDEVISHVIVWLGEYGVSPNQTPLVIDCTGPNHVDSNNNAIPNGVQIRPFTATGWYFKRLDHANRILHSQN